MTLPSLRHHLFRAVICDIRTSVHRNDFVPFHFRWKKLGGKLGKTFPEKSFDLNQFPQTFSSCCSFLNRRYFSTQSKEVDEDTASRLDKENVESGYGNNIHLPTSPRKLEQLELQKEKFAKKRSLLHSKYSLTPSGRFLQPLERSELSRSFIAEMEEILAPLRARVKEQVTSY